MYHSITFGDKNTWEDWRLIPTSRPVINPPAVNSMFIDVTGGNGSIDLTESISGAPTFKDRTGSFEFYVDNDFKPWQNMFSELLMYFHGKRMTLVLEDDPEYTYEGRFALNSWRSDKDRSSITIDYTIGPFKKRQVENESDWLWDDFDFETGYVEYKNRFNVSESLDAVIRCEETVISSPTFISSAEMKLVCNNEQYELTRGITTPVGLVLSYGENRVRFVGNGTVDLKYLGGVL